MADTPDFGAAVAELRPRLVSFALRMLAHPEDADDAVQETLAKAYAKRASFSGRAKLSTWLFSILTRTCIDRLRHRQRWRWDAQHLTRIDPEAPHDEVIALLRHQATTFEIREHIAFCFSCVARSLPPEEASALLLREVFGYTNGEAAEICGVSEPVLRHRLSAARAAMQEAFDRLCALVNKSGLCHQCAGLRDHVPAAHQGPPLPDLSGAGSFRRRLPLVRDANLVTGSAAELHRLLFDAIANSEARRDAQRARSSTRADHE